MKEIDVRKFFPDIIEKYNKDGWKEFLDFMQEISDYYLEKINGVKYFFNAEKTALPIETAKFLGAYINDLNTIVEIKEKISKSIYTHKNLSNFERVIKPILDKIMNQDTQLVKGNLFTYLFQVEISFIDGGSLIEEVSMATEQKPKGVVLIDLKVFPTPAQKKKIIEEIKNLIPIYFSVYIGVATISSGSQFIIDNISLIDYPFLIEQTSSGWTYFSVEKL